MDANGKGYLFCGKSCRDASRAGVAPAASKSSKPCCQYEGGKILTISELAPKLPTLQGPNPGTAGVSASPVRLRTAVASPPNTYEGLKEVVKGYAPCFLEIPKAHPQYDKGLLIPLDAPGSLTDGLLVLDLFQSDWDSPNRAPPKILGIYSIIQSEALVARHDQYRWGSHSLLHSFKVGYRLTSIT